MLHPQLLLQGLQGPGSSSLSRKDLCCGAAHPCRAGLALASSLGMCSERMCQGTLRCNWSWHNLLQTAQNQETLKTPSHSLPWLSSAWF